MTRSLRGGFIISLTAVPYGLSSSFRDWAAEETDHPHEVIEAALAHMVQNSVDAAYRPTDLFERLEDWAAASRRWKSAAIDCLGLVDDPPCSSSALDTLPVGILGRERPPCGASREDSPIFMQFVVSERQ